MFPEVRAEMARHNVTLFMIASDPRINKSVSTMSKKLNGETPLTWAEAVVIRDILNSDMSMSTLFRTETEATK